MGSNEVSSILITGPTRASGESSHANSAPVRRSRTCTSAAAIATRARRDRRAEGRDGRDVFELVMIESLTCVPCGTRSLLCRSPSTRW